MNYLIISTSLNPQSRSRVLAMFTKTEFETLGKPVTLVDLQDYTLPLCNGGDSFGHPQVKEIKQTIRQADTILVASPVYNYSVAASAKNLMDLTITAWEEKIVGLMLSGGGRNSYMAGMGFLNSLMFNARCLIIPRFVYALEEEIGETTVHSPEIQRRLKGLVNDAIQLTERLKAE